MEMKDIELAFKDEDQRKAIIGFIKKMEDSVEDRVQERMNDSILPSDPRARASRKLNQAYNLLDNIWKNNGRRDDVSAPLSMEKIFDLSKDMRSALMKDAAFASTDLPMLMPKVLETQMREAIEPNLNLTPLFQRIRYPGRGTQLTFPSIGGITAAEIAEGEEYPRRKGEMAGSVSATIGKHGLAVQLTEEVMRYSLFDVVGMHMRAAARALARHQENLAFDAISDNATILLSNDSTSYKSTTGRDASGSRNGTMTVYDFLYAWSQLYNDNTTVPNTIIMNPFGWLVFAQDPLMRQLFMNNGSGRLLQLPQGANGSAPQWNAGGLINTTTPTDPKAIATSYTTPPEFWPGQIRVIVSPWVPFNASDNTTDIYICDSNEIGVLVEDEPVVMEEWNDPSVDIRNMKWRTRYGFATMNNGRAIGKIQGVSIARGFDFTDKISLNFSGDHLSGEMVLDDHFRSTSFSGVVP